jgi:uncharacterized repeat protein (TIGR03806 family)
MRSVSHVARRALILLGLWAGCQGGATRPGGDGSYLDELYPRLDQYGMVSLQHGAIVPSEGVTPYDLNTPLFSDGAVKFRTVWVPPGAATTPYDGSQVLDFPVGTILTKSFGFRDDLRAADPFIRWVETRVFVHQTAGWKGVSYRWDDAQRSASVDYGGGLVPLSWTGAAGEPESTSYMVPNGNQCAECHSDRSEPEPIGPKVRNLNRTYGYAGGAENQLTHWAAQGLLAGAPADPSTAPRLPVWNDPNTGTVAERARAYLEANCAHCHSEGGFARTTGLFLSADVTTPAQFGVCKPPVAVGEASGGFLYDVVPGDPDHSILTYRMASTTPSVMMPQIGRSIVDADGLALVREWITGLKGTVPDCGGH